MRKALAQSQSPLAEGPQGSGASGCLAGPGVSTFHPAKGPDQGAPTKATHWDEEIPWSPQNRGGKEGEETFLDKLANF